MGVPKRRSSKQRMRTRKAAQRSPKTQLRTDSKTGSKHRGHCVDPKTGLYRGRQVLSVTAEE
ncbi:MAG: 50S ribosomal protein L32 [Candidatus Methylacidiphilales bacterium]|nr:50S ribosomal protein L32 [Candidatus Methylacidiphilales bacterium]